MRANYHTHTTRCGHAVGTEREYIEAAVEAGIKELGFSDHVPYRFPGFISHIRMDMSEAPEYIEILLRLREEYKKEIHIFIGFEAEYFPQLYDDWIGELSQYPYDYMILGQHFLKPEPDGLYTGAPFYEEAQLADYVDLCLEGLATGHFLYLAHPDLANFRGRKEIYCKHMKRLCEGAKEMNIPLEINLNGYYDRRHYPCEAFFELAAQTGNQVILGTDAHDPRLFAMKDLEIWCRKMAEKLGLSVIEKMNIETK